MDPRINIIGKDGQVRKVDVLDIRTRIKNLPKSLMSDFTTQENTVQFAVAELVHEFDRYEETGENQETLQDSLKKAQKAVAEMNRFLGNFRYFKDGFEPFKEGPAYGIVCRTIDHYWPKFYGTPGSAGFLQIVTYYTEVTNDRNFVM